MGCCPNSEFCYKKKKLPDIPIPAISPDIIEDQNQGSSATNQTDTKGKNSDKETDLPQKKDPNRFKGKSCPKGYSTFYFNEDGMSSIHHDLTLKEGEYSIGQYAFYTDESNTQNLLGFGGFGKVFRGYSSNKDHPQVAIKVMLIDTQQKLQLCRQEALRQQLVKSDGIVKIYMSKVIPHQEKRIFVIASQLMDQGNLKIPEHGFSPQVALDKLKKLLISYGALYKRGMAHRDLKPRNILVNSKGEIKITDFGAAMERTDKRQDSSPLTPEYASPQQARNQEHTNKCDVYAIGCIFFEMLTGLTPKRAHCVTSYNRINIQEFTQKLQQKGVPQNMITFMKGCLREKQVVEMDGKDGKKVEDPSLSRFSWERLYLDPLFQGQLRYIPQQVAGRSILLTLKSYSESNSVNLFNLLNAYRLRSQVIKKSDLVVLLKDRQIPIVSSDIDRLHNMFGCGDALNIDELMQELKNVDSEQYSNYSVKEAVAYLEMCKSSGIDYYRNNQLIQQIQYLAQFVKRWINMQQLMEYLKNGYFSLIQQLWIHINFPSFPLLPPSRNLTYIWIANSKIQLFEARLNTPNLQILNVRDSEIQKIIAIRGCPNLRVLRLGQNKIRQIEGLQMLYNINHLDFSKNRLYSISGINHLKLLITLNLFDNRISAIEGIQTFPWLQQLHLGSNRIREISDKILMFNVQRIKQIYLNQNKIKATQNNIKVAQKFRQKYPNSVLYLSGHIYVYEDFQESKQYFHFEDGEYYIKWFIDHSYLGIKKDQENIPDLALVEENNQQKSWFFKHFQNDEYCILTADRSEIVGGYYCQIKPYSEQMQQEEDEIMRWAFEKKGKDQYGQPLFYIRNMRENKLLTCDNSKNLHLYSSSQLKEGKNVENSELWYIKPIIKVQ